MFWTGKSIWKWWVTCDKMKCRVHMSVVNKNQVWYQELLNFYHNCSIPCLLWFKLQKCIKFVIITKFTHVQFDILLLKMSMHNIFTMCTQALHTNTELFIAKGSFVSIVKNKKVNFIISFFFKFQIQI